MNSYCTLIDKVYLIRWLTMYHSLIEKQKDMQLFVVAFDRRTYEAIQRLELRDVILISQEEVETHNPRLLNIKEVCTSVEYCWACVPAIIAHIFRFFEVKELVYLDSDLYFFSSPQILLDEFHASGKDVMLTRHFYSPAYAHQTDLAGDFNVQFMPFKNNVNGNEVLSWWQERCESSYLYPENGVFDDQRSLTECVQVFDCIYILQNRCGGVAPWNVQQYKVEMGPTIDSQLVVFFHFHALRWFGDNRYAMPADFYELNRDVHIYIYWTYIDALKKSLSEIREKADDKFSLGIKESEYADTIVIFGTGKMGIAFFEYLSQLNCQDAVVAFCDNNSSKWGGSIYEREIKSVEACIKQYPEAQYVVTGKYVKEMENQLITLGISNILSEVSLKVYTCEC